MTFKVMMLLLSFVACHFVVAMDLVIVFDICWFILLTKFNYLVDELLVVMIVLLEQFS